MTVSNNKESENRKARLIMTVLAVSDLEKSTRFYREAFGWPVSAEEPVVTIFDLPCGSSLMVYDREAFGHNTGQAPELPPKGAVSGTELYFHVEDLDESVERLRAAGARELSEPAPRPWGDEAAYFADPDGNVLVAAKPL